ncbi:MAG: FG-GAP-like repeat-containing protein [Bacteroidetes bacterium]|nr:FG-GAP-like repeat-containing protein [Bacteroidota bacterium]
MVVILMLIITNISGQSFSFRKINSGTKADIRTILHDDQKNVYFLTDKIYKLENDIWKKLDFPVEGKIYTIYPVSAKDVWFTVNQVTNTCMLYHYHDGITENVRSPFANQIFSIYFISENRALFAGIADMAVYENGSFRMLPPSPARFYNINIFGKDLSAFWILTKKGELFLYKRGIYKKVLGDIAITDFCFADMHNGYLLSGEKLFRVDGSGIILLLKSTDLQQVRKIYLMENGTVLMVGDKGLILSYANGHLSRHSVQCTENLTDLVATGPENIWICGENGRLLYSGEKQFPKYLEDNQGFSSHKLISYWINTDDEYGVAMADFNGDDKTDIYAVRIYEQNRLYINNLVSAILLPGIDGFAEEAVKRNANGVINPETNTAQNELKLGIGVADIDNDNDQDIYLCYLNSVNKLLLNRGNGYFRNVSGQKNRACENMNRSNAAAFADVDNDGDLDLFVTNEEGSNRLFENDGTGHFSDITATSGLGSIGGGMCASFADVNNDGYPDLCVSFWYPSNKLYINESKNGRIHFRDVTNLTDLAKATPSKSNAVAFADVNNDGFTDLFIANRNTGNKLYLNNGKGIFTDKTRDYFQPENYMSNGAVFADFDLDGYQDLYITNVGENVLYKNMDGRYFKDVTAIFGAEMSGYCTGCAAGDVDNDGDPDLYVANYINGNSNLFLNITEKKTFVKIKLHGVRSNKDAIGAKIWLYKVPGDKHHRVLAGYRELNGGSSYGSVSAKEMIFGVEPRAEYYILIKFPSSPDTLREDHIVAGKILEISELKGFPAFYTERRNSFVRFFKDQENQPEIVKYALILLLLVIYNLKLRRSIRSIAIFRWLASGFVFVVFVFVNRSFLFQWLSVSFFLAPLVVLGLLAIVHLFIDRILLRRLALKEKLDLREKLSRDLHDDLASTLGSISIYAETLKGMNKPSPPDFNKLPVKIAGLTQSALQSISDIIWMTSPRNDSLQSLISKTSNYMLEILTDNKINFRPAINIPDDPIILQEKIRNDAFLILKEGLHNIIRHAGAGNVEFSAEIKENICTIYLKDDGVGMVDSKQTKKGSHGNGLVNMRRRAQESEIDFTIHSGEGAGTEIIMHFKI